MSTHDLLVTLAGASTALAAALLIALGSAVRRMTLPRSAVLGGVVMLAGLVHTAWQHVGLVALGPDGIPPTTYGAGLFLQSWGFYALLSGVLRPVEAKRGGLFAMGAATVLLALFVPATWAVPASLALGTGYTAHLALLLFRLRATRRWFRVEWPVVLLFVAMGVMVGGAGALTPHSVSWEHFALLYSLQLALGFLLATALLLGIPDLAAKTADAVSASYAQSSLGKVYVQATAERLLRLFEDERVYLNEDLGLAALARRLDLTPHQLSEMLNVHFGESYSRFVRRHRVLAAQRMLIDEPRASVLSVGLAVGFGSQSAFYAAFKEETGLVPGEFRRQAEPDSPSN